MRKRSLAALASVIALIVASAGPAEAHHRSGSEPTHPYAQPALAPMRGCGTIVTNPAEPTGSPAAVQVLYAWHAGEGNNYDASVERIARIVDRIDWLLDQSTDYDQHLRLSCSKTPNGTYADYARALVAPVQIEEWSSPSTSSGTVRKWINRAGYDDTNRWYLVLTDFESESDASLPLCTTTGGCSAVVEEWDSGVAGHELLHTFGAGHAWVTESGHQYCPDIMGPINLSAPDTCGWDGYWNMDADFNTYYDPSETTASFHIDPYPSTTTWNVARSPALTTPVCCDVGASTDLFTAAERTVEASLPGTVPVGYTRTGGAVLTVTPPCTGSGVDLSVSCRYFDGRRSLQVVTSQTFAVSGVSVTRRPVVTPRKTYAFKAALRSDSPARVRVRLVWFDAAGTLLSETQSGDIALTTGWQEHYVFGKAPVNAALVQARITTPFAQPAFVFQADSLQLGHSQADGAVDLLDFEGATTGNWTKLRNKANGTFEFAGFAVSGVTKPEHVLTIDYNLDGHMDLLDFEGATTGSWRKLRNNGNATFSSDGFALTGQTRPQQAVTIDYNRDGHLDFLVFEASANGSWIKVKNNGNGTFTRETAAVTGMTTPHRTVILDYNNDGNVDIFAFEISGGSWVRLRNNGNGTFTHAGFAVSGMTPPEHALLVDYDRDGDQDLLGFEVPFGGWVRLKNNGTGTLSHDGFAVTGLPTPQRAVSMDYDFDGDQDLLNYEATPSAAWAKLKNNGFGSFTRDGNAVTGMSVPQAVVTMDWGG